MKHLNALILLGIASLPVGALACPGCQNPNLPMASSGGVYLAAGEVKVGAGMAATLIDVEHEAGCTDVESCDEVPVQPRYIHDQRIVPMELRATLEWGVTDRFGLEATLPLRIVHTTIDYKDLQGRDYQPLDADVHHRNETLVGLADPLVGGRLGVLLGDATWLVARLGVSLPLGRTEPDPFEAGDRGEKHQHIQFGSGTFNPQVGLDLARAFGRLQAGAYGQLRAALYENSHGFQAGTRSLVGARGAWRFGQRVVAGLSLEWLRDGPEHWSGEVRQDGILGRHEVLVGLGTTVSFGGPQYSLLLRSPVYRDIILGDEDHGGDLSAPLAASFDVQWSF
jgi:hypothetical protein